VFFGWAGGFAVPESVFGFAARLKSCPRLPPFFAKNAKKNGAPAWLVPHARSLDFARDDRLGDASSAGPESLFWCLRHD
jgi:hypothetical protein